MFVTFRRPPTMYCEYDLKPNYVRFRISPDIAIAFCFNDTLPTNECVSEASEMVASRRPCPDEPEAYERVLTDAMEGDQTLFAREDYVEEAWRIVDPVLQANTPIYEYEPGTWGPAEAKAITPPGGWRDPDTAGNK